MHAILNHNMLYKHNKLEIDSSNSFAFLGSSFKPNVRSLCDISGLLLCCSRMVLQVGSYCQKTPIIALVSHYKDKK